MYEGLIQEDLLELLDAKTSLHDKHRFEVKLDVMLDGQKRARYSVVAYFFIPRSLGINGTTYPAAAFYRDIQNYIRFKTPVIGLRMLVDDDYAYSPFKRLDEAVQAILGGDRSARPIKRAVHELKLLGCVVRSGVRDRVHNLLEATQNAPSHRDAEPAATDLLESTALAFLSDLRVVLQKFRSLRPQMLDPILPAKIREAYTNLDEFMSLTSESYLTILLNRLSTGPVQLSTFEKELKTTIAFEQGHRSATGAIATLVEAHGDNETFAQRRSMLKKYVSSLLYLNIKIKEAGSLGQAALNVGAAAAIGIYLLATTLAAERFSFDSLAFLMIASGAYIFREGIKERLKHLFTTSMAGWLTDRSANVIDPSSGNVTGRFKEAVSFVPASSVPESIRRLRTQYPTMGAEADGELVLKYIKRVRLFPARIAEHHHRLKSVNDILRFSVQSFLARMDDPNSEYLFYNVEHGETETAQIARTYPVDVVFTLTADGPRTRTYTERLRLVLNRSGIQRMEG